MRKILILAIITLNATILFYACKKDKVVDTPDYDTQTSQDNSLAESTFNDVNNIVNEAVSRGDSGLSTYRIGKTQNTLLSTCATVTVTPDSINPGGSITVDFTSTNCLCADGRKRRGIINIEYTGPYRDSGTVITTTFSNYFVGRDDNNMFQVTGTKVVVNKGLNTNGNLNFDINVNGHLIDKNGANMTWTSSRNREWLAGSATLFNWLDDEYSITGSATGTNFEGNSFSVNITSPLIFKLNCRWITQGVFELTPSGKATRTLDYGNGSCDANATVLINGTSFPITLR